MFTRLLTDFELYINKAARTFVSFLSSLSVVFFSSALSRKLRVYAEDRNDPNEQNVASNLSPWFHFGQANKMHSFKQPFKKLFSLII